MILSWSCLVLVHLTSTFLASIVLSYFGPLSKWFIKSRLSWKCASELYACVGSCTKTNSSVSILLTLHRTKNVWHTLEKISGESNFGQSKCSKIRQSEIWSVRNILQYSIKFFSSSKALSFHEANSSWDTVWDAWRSDRIRVIFFSVYL